MSSTPDNIIIHYLSVVCPKCGTVHTPDEIRFAERRQVLDIPPIQIRCTEHQLHKAVCSCGHIHEGRFPIDVTAPVQYGKNVISLTAYLSSRQYIPYARLCELMKNITGITMSEGTVYNLLNKAAILMSPLYQQIKKEIAASPVIGGDETGLIVNGKCN